MKKIISYLLICTLCTCSMFILNINETKALEKNDAYVTHDNLTAEEKMKLLDEYNSVVVYRSGTHSTDTVLSDKTDPYGFIGYHPNTPNWTTATGYSVSSSKTVNFNISVSFNIKNAATIKIGAASSSTKTFSNIYTLTDKEIDSIRNKGNRSRLGVYAKVRKKVVNYKIYDNATGLLLQDYNYVYLTTWDADNNINEVDYHVKLKNKV